MKQQNAYTLWEAIGGADDSLLLRSEALTQKRHRVPSLLPSAAAILLIVGITLTAILRIGDPSAPGEIPEDWAERRIVFGDTTVSLSLPEEWVIAAPSTVLHPPYDIGYTTVRVGGESGDPITAFVGVMSWDTASDADPLDVLNFEYNVWDRNESYRVIFLDDAVETAVTAVIYDWSKLPEELQAQMRVAMTENTGIVSLNRAGGKILAIEFCDGLIGFPPLEDGMAEAIASTIEWADGE